MRIKLSDIEAAQLVATISGIQALQNEANLLLQQRGIPVRIQRLKQRQQTVADSIQKRAKAPNVPIEKWDLSNLDTIKCKGSVNIPEQKGD